MSNINNLSPEALKRVGNYTKGAVESFEENIISQHNYLEKVAANHNKNAKK